jgi:hypothetical protein
MLLNKINNINLENQNNTNMIEDQIFKQRKYILSKLRDSKQTNVESKITMNSPKIVEIEMENLVR